MWKNFVLCKITVISAIHVGKTESETNTVVFTTYLPSPFLPTPFGLSLTLWQDITRPFHLFPVCELFFSPPCVSYSSLFVYIWSLCVCRTDCCCSSCTLQIHHLSTPVLLDLYFSIHQIFQICQHTSYAMANLQVQELFVLVEIQLVLFSASGSLLPLLPPQFTLPTSCHSTASRPPELATRIQESPAPSYLHHHPFLNYKTFPSSLIIGIASFGMQYITICCRNYK